MEELFESCSEDTDDDEFEFKIDPSLIFTRLTKIVRTQYLRYLKTTLQQNVLKYANENMSAVQNADILSQQIVETCALKLERRAIKACMWSQVYQRNMRDTIMRIKRQSESGQLDKLLKQQLNNAKENLKENSSVCSNVTANSLEQKIANFEAEILQENAKANERKELIETKVSNGNAMETCQTNVKFYDEIEQEMAEMFSEEKTEFDELLGFDAHEIAVEPQMQHILQEIEKAQLPIDKQQATTLGSHVNGTISPSPPAEQLVDMAATTTAAIQTNLSKSIWPCELYMQTCRLTENCIRLAEQDLRNVDAIGKRFEQLFGADSDDEFANHSPSIELDTQLISSCMLRIMPWVVKYASKAFYDGLIANKFIFKKFVKTMARNIVLMHQYATEQMVKEAVENYFCIHKSIRTLDDIT